jgi:cytoskeletal protein CcmA (bactofilin family)
MDNKEPNIDNDSLETPEVDNKPSDVVAYGALKTVDEIPKENVLKTILSKLNIYFLFLILTLLVLAAISFYSISQNNKNDKKSVINNTKLTNEALTKLSGTDSSVGDAKQTLTVESNAIFTGGVLIKGNIDIAGVIKVGSNLTLPSLNVGGITSVEQLAAKSLTVNGDTSIQGKVSIQNGISVKGGASFSGGVSAPQITVDKLLLNGDLQITRHITANGGLLGRTNGSALGGGGTASSSGNDTAGTIIVNTGNSAPAGCFVTLSFNALFANVPHVVLSPSSSNAASLEYYTIRTTSGFSVCTANDPPDSTSGITFDYIVIG